MGVPIIILSWGAEKKIKDYIITTIIILKKKTIKFNTL